MSEAQKRILRFGILERIEHFVLILSFTTLGLTGLPQKYATSPISQAVVNSLGGIEGIRVIHRIAAAIFLLEAIYHIIVVGYKLYVQRKQATMVPGIKDAKDAAQWFGFNLGFVRNHPKMPRYNFAEKAEYLAMLWGLILMGLTGLMLWNPIATTNLLPGEFIPAAKAAHGAEAVLAVLAIILWHFYHVHIKHWNWAMFKGTLSRHEMEIEHGEELEQIESGRLPQLPSAEQRRKRLAIFTPIASVVTIALLALTIYFLTFEESAITTVPPVSDVPVFVRATPTLTPSPALPPQAGGASEASWASIGPMLADKCGSCHGDTGGFNAESYETVMEAVEPFNPDSSRIVEVMREDHPVTLDDQELANLIQWITDGATNEAAQTETEPGGTAAGAEVEASWASLGPILAEKCGSCHGDTGGFNAESYETVMEAVSPFNPDSSRIVETMRSEHPANLDEQELQALVQWIVDGAEQGAAEGGDGAASGGAAPNSWDGGIGALFEDQCASCHGSMGGFSAESYDAVLEAIQPGDPDASLVVQAQQGGDHPGQFSEEDLAAIIAWIELGAPQQ